MELLAAALEVLQNCHCPQDVGCPRCVQVSFTLNPSPILTLLHSLLASLTFPCCRVSHVKSIMNFCTKKQPLWLLRFRLDVMDLNISSTQLQFHPDIWLFFFGLIRVFLTLRNLSSLLESLHHEGAITKLWAHGNFAQRRGSLLDQ